MPAYTPKGNLYHSIFNINLLINLCIYLEKNGPIATQPPRQS